MNIVAMGGGGFSMEPANLTLDRYVLALANRQRPRVCFVPTASGDSPAYIARFYAAFGELPCEPSHLPFFERTPPDLRAFVFEKDVIYVGGGNTRSMLAVWREWGFDAVLREAWTRGIVLAGISAGANCWFESCVTDSVAGELTAMPCLSLVSGSFCPHYDGEAERRPSFQRMVATGAIGDGFAADDGCALHFAGQRLTNVISSRPAAKAYRLKRAGPAAIETVLEPGPHD